MCDFCEKAKNFFDEKDTYDMRIRKSVNGGGKELFCYDDYCKKGFLLRIAFCPICGRKLEEEKELPWVTVGNWKPVEAKEIGKPQEKIEVANFESDWRKNAVYLEDDCK